MGSATKCAIAGVYKITCKLNDKVYIGETKNLKHRKTDYVNMHQRTEPNRKTPIVKAVLKHGWDNFKFEILESSDDNPLLFDATYRINREAAYIKKYNATNKKYGYNVVEYNNTPHTYNRPKGIKNSTKTRLKLSDQILAYDSDDGSVIMYLSKRALADDLDKDRAITARSAKYGRAIDKHIYAYMLDPDKRKAYAKKAIREKMDASWNSLAYNTLNVYIDGLKACNEYCERWGYATINVDKLIREIAK